ncbi:hypothetical protein V5O48_012661 [Marasmius crinis-equi]|uniref:Uncharacterized protein n=1 Tax=Marasmius crinis-equi TaxID=585013 RepID=A0ABR3F2F7_9AGAR
MNPTAAKQKQGKVTTSDVFSKKSRRRVGLLSAGLASTSGMLSIISGVTGQSYALTVGFGVGAGFCSLVAGSIGFYEQLYAKSPRKKEDPEQGRIPIELKLSSSISLFRDVEVPVTTAVKQTGALRARNVARPSYTPYDPSLRSKTYSEGHGKRRRRGTQVAEVSTGFQAKKKLVPKKTPSKSQVKGKFNGITFLESDAVAASSVAVDVIRAAETANTNRIAFRLLAAEVSALAHTAVGMCSVQVQARQSSDDQDATKSHMDAVIRNTSTASEGSNLATRDIPSFVHSRSTAVRHRSRISNPERGSPLPGRGQPLSRSASGRPGFGLKTGEKATAPGGGVGKLITASLPDILEEDPRQRGDRPTGEVEIASQHMLVPADDLSRGWNYIEDSIGPLKHTSSD